MLSHLRILDFTDGGASVAGRMLADLGADVVLIEPPGGIASRASGPFADDEPGPDRSLEFWASHRGKRSITLDLDRQMLPCLKRVVRTQLLRNFQRYAHRISSFLMFGRDC